MTRRAGLLVAVLAFTGTCAAFMQTILIPLQPRLPALLSTSGENAAWMITATLVSGAVCTPIAGRLGDMYGKRRIALSLLVIQTVGSLIAAVSSAWEPMIVARVLQGASMGIVPLGIALLRDVLPKERLGTAIALVSVTLGVGGALGLPLCAVLIERFDWHVLFWMAAGLGVACVTLYAAVVPKDSTTNPARLDVPGIVGLSVGLVAVLVGVSRGGEWGWSAPPTLIALVGGVAVLVVWGLVELRVREPLVDLRVSARPAVLLTNLASVAMGFALFAPNIVFPQLLELPRATGIGLGLTVVAAALVLAPPGLTMLAVTPFAGRAERRRGPQPLLVCGAGVVAVSYAGAIVFHDEVWQILVVNIVIGIGFGLGYGAMPALITQAVPVGESGAANGLNALMRALGTSASSAVLGAVLASSTSTVGGVRGPTESAFVTALVLGLIAALLCLLLGLFIPRERERHRGS
ncbi:MFS transporter [Microbacterium sp. RD1]|uniref:MFS transporter n=1 Tax=Microbacterium sp. RD1 TaxID=3457313 RepID=UPI003FA59F90